MTTIDTQKSCDAKHGRIFCCCVAHFTDLGHPVFMDKLIQGVEVVFPCPKLSDTLSFFTERLGFRLDLIYPADCPSVAVLSGHGVCLRLQEGSEAPLSNLRLLCKNPTAFADGASEIVAPNGTHIKIVEANPPVVLPPLRPSFVFQKMATDGDGWIAGRAGMLYRDLIPDRQGGRFIASHIKFPNGGPVPDYVHFHRIRFQMIYCFKGWVRVGYEDQGELMTVHAGDCLLQPPQIRHRVFESSPGLEVLEISCPAEHETFADHKLELPNSTVNLDRTFEGQRFVHHQALRATWHPWESVGFEHRDIGIGSATQNLAGVRVIRSARVESLPSHQYFHSGEFLFLFVLQGEMTLATETRGDRQMLEGDCCVIPAQFRAWIINTSADLELLEVSLPAFL